MPTTYAIPNGATQFAATLWSGNNGTQSINNAANTSGTSFQPDFAWVKKRNGTDNHELTDSVRGNNLRLASNTTDNESAGGIAFASNGLTLTGGFGTDNQTGFTYVGWQWKSSNATAVTNTDGTITSQVSANPTAGFSIVTYTGTGANGTVGHGLGTNIPKMVIIKNRTNVGVANNWSVYNSNIGSNVLLLNATSGSSATDATNFCTLGANTLALGAGNSSFATQINVATETYVAYCWSEINGYSKFGSYVGAATFPFVYLGFRARFLMIKNSSSAGNHWIMIDTTRDTYNLSIYKLGANVATQENDAANVGTAANNTIDILSNGFKLRTTNGDTNGAGTTYIYMAFAENPFKYANAR